jgi:cyclase
MYQGPTFVAEDLPTVTGPGHDPIVTFDKRGLIEIASGTYAYLRPPGTWGWSNSGLVVEGDDAILIDTAYTGKLTTEMLEQIGELLPGVHISRAVLTHGNGDHTFGAGSLDGVGLITALNCADTLEHEVSPAMMETLMAEGPEPIRSYMREHFSPFDFSDATLPEIDETFTGRTSLKLGDREVELIEVGPAHTGGDVVVHVPDRHVVYTGDIVFADDTPLVWESVEGAARACTIIEQTGATRVVPGHGPVVDSAYLAIARGYYEHILECADLFGRRDGLPYHEAAARVPLERYSSWKLPERIVVSMAAAYRDLGLPVGDDFITILNRMAHLADAVDSVDAEHRRGPDQ